MVIHCKIYLCLYFQMTALRLSHIIVWNISSPSPVPLSQLKFTKTTEYLLSPADDSQFSLPYSMDLLKENLTVVSAYFNIGKFPKGSKNNIRDPDEYYKWMKIFSCLKSYLIMFVETSKDVAYIKKLRQDIDPSLTHIVKVNRSDLWAFHLRSKIAAIYSNPEYPKQYPNTVNPDYTCVTHAKFDIMYLAVRTNVFHTRYFSWLDAGYFRRANTNKAFLLTLPPHFNHSCVAFTNFRKFKPTNTAVNIMHGHSFWIAGGFFVAEVTVMMRFYVC